MEDKKSLRSKMRGTLSKLSKEAYENYSEAIAGQLYKELVWEKANVIGITISKPPEVDTYRIIQKAWEQGKRVVVPKCYPNEKKMVFRELSEFSQLESVFYGLLEPMEEKTLKVESNEIDLMIVPGLAYTLEGYRLGFGGGYYDRYLKHFNGNKLVLAFECQIIPQLKVESHDIPVTKIITNKMVHEVK